MALNYQSLWTGLVNLFTDPPSTVEECASEWASIMEDYSRFVSPFCNSVVDASNALDPLLLFAFINSRDNTEECNTLNIGNAFNGFANIIATGMLGNPHLTLGGTTLAATPPPVFVDLCIAVQANYVEAGTEFANNIEAWMKKGTALVQVSPPPAALVLVNWE